LRHKGTQSRDYLFASLLCQRLRLEELVPLTARSISLCFSFLEEKALGKRAAIHFVPAFKGLWWGKIDFDFHVSVLASGKNCIIVDDGLADTPVAFVACQCSSQAERLLVILCRHSSSTKPSSKSIPTSICSSESLCDSSPACRLL